MPRFIRVPNEVVRQRLSLRMGYYSAPWGEWAQFQLVDNNGNQLDSVTAKFGPGWRANQENPDGHLQYPSYSVLVARGISDVIEHRKMEPIFYVTDDPNIKAKLGLKN